jgi:DNA-binding NtrC family response regulator
LEAKGYVVDTAESGKEAIEKSNKAFYNVALIDIRLPDMEGTKLLTAMKETIPKMIKIIVTGYPALKNAVEAVNNGANAYVMKPPNMNEILDTIKEQLRKQREERHFSEEKIADFIQQRILEIDNETHA